MEYTEFTITQRPALQDPTVPIDTIRIVVKGDDVDIVRMLISAMETHPLVFQLSTSAMVQYLRTHGKVNEFLQGIRIMCEVLDDLPGS